MTTRAPMAPLAVLLAGLAMIGPFAIDTYLPAFPAIQAGLGVSQVQMQQTLSLYLVAFAVMMLFHGTLSDSFGRRPVVLANLVVFLLASAGCALAATFEQLLLFRTLQGASAGAGFVVGRAIIRDSFEGAAAQRLMSLVTMIFGFAPAVAPIVGGLLQQALGWRAVFAFLGVYAALVLVACSVRLPETLPAAARQPFRLATLAGNYWTLGRSRSLFLVSTAIAFNFAGFFIYILSAPAFVYGILELTAADFPWVFMPGIVGVMSGAFVAARVAGRWTQQRIVRTAFAIMFGAAALNLAYCAVAQPALPWAVVPIAVYTFGMALAMPTLTLTALDLFPMNRGLAASLMGFEHSFVSAIAAGALSPVISGSALALALGMAGLLAIGCGAWCLYLMLKP